MWPTTQLLYAINTTRTIIIAERKYRVRTILAHKHTHTLTYWLARHPTQFRPNSGCSRPSS